MNRIRVKRLQLISILCIISLIIELVYVGYHILYRSEESIYFEGINAIVAANKYYVSVGSNNDNDNHFEKAKISKYNIKKEKTFEKLYNVGYNSSFFGVALDGDDIVAVGSYEKTLEEHEQSIRRALIVKYDLEGNIIFENDFSLLDNSQFVSIHISDDYYYVVGQSIYKNTRVGNGNGGAIINKYDKDGNLIWSKTFGSCKNAIFNDLIIINDTIFTVGTDDNYLGIIAKYDLDGNLLTYNDYQTTDSLGFSGIVNLGENIYVCGAIRRDNNDNDAIIVRYNLDCTYIDQVIYTGDGIERFNKMIVDFDDNIVAIGTMATMKNYKNISDYNYDGIAAKYDKNLKVIDSISYGDDRDDYFTDINYVGDEYLVVGYSSYEDGSFMSKFIRYSKALKVLGVL